MEFCIENELQSKVVHRPQCGSTGILVALDEVTSIICVGCLEHNANNKFRKKAQFNEA